MVRESFSYEEQLAVIFKYMTDQTQTPNSKVRRLPISSYFITNNDHLICFILDKVHTAMLNRLHQKLRIGSVCRKIKLTRKLLIGRNSCFEEQDGLSIF